MIRTCVWPPSTDHCGSGAHKAAVRWAGSRHARYGLESSYAMRGNDCSANKNFVRCSCNKYILVGFRFTSG